jgi:hypothetical protein
MKHMRALNKKAGRIDDYVVARTEDVVGMQDPAAQQRPHVPMGCALMFTPGWEVDAAGGTAGLSSPWSATSTIASPVAIGRRRFPTT